jgi:hypothetical protein
MEKPALGDPGLFPDEAVLAATLGRSKAAYDELLARCGARCPELEAGWKYYNDGKSWLFKAQSKKKSLFWLSARPGSFRTTFYFPTRAEESVLGSELPDSLKEQYGQSAGKKFRGITLELKAKKDLASFEKLLALKIATG